MEQDPLTLLISGICGAGILLFTWAVVRLGLVIEELTKQLAGGVVVMSDKAGVYGDKKGT